MRGQSGVSVFLNRESMREGAASSQISKGQLLALSGTFQYRFNGAVWQAVSGVDRWG